MPEQTTMPFGILEVYFNQQEDYNIYKGNNYEKRIRPVTGRFKKDLIHANLGCGR
jgi:hypothetical protein